MVICVDYRISREVLEYIWSLSGENQNYHEPELAVKNRVDVWLSERRNVQLEPLVGENGSFVFASGLCQIAGSSVDVLAVKVTFKI